VPPTRRWHFADRSIRLLGYRVPAVVGPRSPRLRRSRKRSRSRRTRRRDSEPGRSSRPHQRHQRLDVRPPLGVQRGLPGVAKQEHALPPAARCSCRKQSRSLETRPAVSWKSSWLSGKRTPPEPAGSDGPDHDGQGLQPPWLQRPSGCCCRGLMTVELQKVVAGGG